jgi:hypothetical protein
LNDWADALCLDETPSIAVYSLNMVADAAPPRKKRLMPTRIPEHVRLAVRSMYVVHGKPPSEIARTLGMSPGQLSSLIQREKWTVLRSQKQSERSAKAIALQDARSNDDIARVVETTAVLSEELSIRSLNLSSELLDAKDPKGLQMASGAALNFVKIARLSRRLDGNQGPQEGSTVNLWIVRGETVERSEKRVENAVEIAPALLPK